jgi:hypothetical protein
MRGHEAIIELRRNRMAPPFVFINDYPCDTDWLQDRAGSTVCVAGDHIPALDLRYLIGLKVSISSESEARAKALFDACKAAGARTVAACHIKPERRDWEQDGWATVWRKD